MSAHVYVCARTCVLVNTHIHVANRIYAAETRRSVD